MSNPNTIASIRKLAVEALAAGDHTSDYTMHDLCNRALATDTVDQDGNAITWAVVAKDDAVRLVRRIILLNALRDLHTGGDSLDVVVTQALIDDINVTAADIRQIVATAIVDHAAEMAVRW